MNYRHIYHAGNFGDVLKHVVLIALLQSLLRKETALCYLETHAGIGYYDLSTLDQQKNPEFENGIQKVLAAKNPPFLIQQYIDYVKKINSTSTLQFYPGSPWLAKNILRAQDRMVLCEWHHDEYQTLKKNFLGNKQIHIHHQDGYQGLKAFLPPKERRGLVLIDPAYEKPTELMSLPGMLANTLKRWETGVYAIWYPIKTRQLTIQFCKELSANIRLSWLNIELVIYPDDTAAHLNGSGMIIINPPWQLEQQLREPLQWLRNILPKQPSHHYD